MIRKNSGTISSHRKWAEFRFSVIGGLFAAPPEKGHLQEALKNLSEKTWVHPITGDAVKFNFSTIENWYYKARNEKTDTVKTLQSKVRSDFGESRMLNDEEQTILRDFYITNPCLSYQLYADNLMASLLLKDPSRTAFPSYATVRRFMQTKGFLKKKLPRNPDRQAALDSLKTKEQQEVRSYEHKFVNGLWHLDFHKSSIKIVDDRGIWHTPSLLGIYDDHSRLACHVQWYLHETAENLVHGFCQALQKRGLPRELMSDNGSAMKSEEFKEGLLRLGIIWSPTRIYAPFQNGKCENVWSRVEGRLLAMLRGYKDLTLQELNDITQAWAEMEYNRIKNRETGDTPIERFIKSKDIGRPCPDGEILKNSFTIEVQRKQRFSDGTVTLEGRRYEIPSRFRTLIKITIKYSRWDLRHIHMIDPKTGTILCKLYPLDKAENASGLRRKIQDSIEINPIAETTELMPYLKKLVDDYSALCPIPAYLTKDESKLSQKEVSDNE